MIGRMRAVSVRDARALLDIAGAVEYDPRSGFAPEGLTALGEMLQADWVSYCERPVTSLRLTVDVEVGTRPFTGHTETLHAIYIAHRDEFPLHWAARSADGVMLIGDVTTAHAWRRTAIYNKWCRVVHISPQATVALESAGSPVERSLRVDLADDAGRSFGERERSILKLIRPSFMRPIACAEAVRERHRALGLTSRELGVLAYVRDGMTNGEIASELFISPGTVRSHLEHAFAKIGAHTRTEAVARLDEIGRPPRG
jgi:DNA-binding CsgD family transcriptional regulator